MMESQAFPEFMKQHQWKQWGEHDTQKWLFSHGAPRIPMWVFFFSLASLVHFIFLIQTVWILTPCKRTHISKKERVKVCHDGISCACIHQLLWFWETHKKGADIKHINTLRTMTKTGWLDTQMIKHKLKLRSFLLPECSAIKQMAWRMKTPSLLAKQEVWGSAGVHAHYRKSIGVIL